MQMVSLPIIMLAVDYKKAALDIWTKTEFKKHWHLDLNWLPNNELQHTVPCLPNVQMGNFFANFKMCVFLYIMTLFFSLVGKN